MFQKSSLANSLFSKNFCRAIGIDYQPKLLKIILKQTRELVAKEKKLLNKEFKQCYRLYSLFNEKGHLGQLFSREEKCCCLSCRESIDYKCPKKDVTYYLKTLTLTRKVKVFHLGRNLFKAEPQILRCRELTLANPLALECFLRPVRNPKLY